MDIRYSVNQRDFKGTLQKKFAMNFLLILFLSGDVTAVYSHVDRMVTLGAMPVNNRLSMKEHGLLEKLGTQFFLERRELGIINIGGEGKVFADENVYTMGNLDALYLPMGTKIEFSTGTESAKFYMCSAPAHKACPAKHITSEEAAQKELGDSLTANRELSVSTFTRPFLKPASFLWV